MTVEKGLGDRGKIEERKQWEVNEDMGIGE